ncbi:MAG: methylenetetrahydrofolate reductase [Clostridiales Family XIII bacterium]|jgi:methylenetetrahydrofolate reductase (NADPH)|nr:methylenetetrahydrofolate reductase [Clostridiales Family XIII bacterium]
MKIENLLKKKRTISFEVFPPKNDKPIEPLIETLSHLEKLNPDFISVTFGAGGSNQGRALEISKMISDFGIESLQHFTCVGSDKKTIDEMAKKFTAARIHNLLLLRGDYPKTDSLDKTNHTNAFSLDKSAFKNASDLIKYFSENYPDFSIGAAAYPETHLEALSNKSDVRFLKLKQDLGAKFFITQLCFDENNFYNWCKKIKKAGVHIPIIAGLMPVLYKEGIIKICLQNGCSIPKNLSRIIGKYGDDSADFKKAGIEFTRNLIEKIQNAGADGIHLYTLNKYKDVEEIISTVHLLHSI